MNYQEKWDYCLYVAWVNNHYFSTAYLNFIEYSRLDIEIEDLADFAVKHKLKRFLKKCKKTGVKNLVFGKQSTRVVFGSHFIKANGSLMGVKASKLTFEIFLTVIKRNRWNLLAGKAQRDLTNAYNNVNAIRKTVKPIKARELSSTGRETAK